MPLLHILVGPPCKKLRVRLILALHLPINLRREIIKPAFLLPFLGIGIQRGILIEALHARWILRPPNPKRADPHQHPWLGLLHLFIHPFDEMIDVLTSPVVAPELYA